MDKLWKSNLSRNIKITLFQVTAEKVLTYGSDTWTLNKKLNKSLDGSYTRMLRKVLDVSWKQHITNKVLYGKLNSISQVIRKRRLMFAGNSFRQKQLQPVSELVLWEPNHGHRGKGCPKKTFVDTLKSDTGCKNTQELAACMEDRSEWRRIVSRCSDKIIDR